MIPRSYLYVPADRFEMLAKSATLGADVVVADLEDGVSAVRKREARDNVADWLANEGRVDRPLRWVRLNASEDLLAADLELVEFAADRVDGVSLPKAESEQQVRHLRQHLPEHVAIVPLIESARGLAAVGALATAPGVVRLGMGETDLITDLGLAFDATDGELASIRLQVVVTAAAARLASPIAAASTNFNDLDSFRASTLTLRRLGFGARSLIHPAQVEICHQVFGPTTGEVERARRIIALGETAADSGLGVFVDDEGRMVDEAVLRWARGVVDADLDRGVEGPGSAPGVTVGGSDD